MICIYVNIMFFSLQYSRRYRNVWTTKTFHIAWLYFNVKFFEHISLQRNISKFIWLEFVLIFNKHEGIKYYVFINLGNLDIHEPASPSNSLFRSCRTLLMVLYRRDCRRPFAPAGHWLISDLKISSFFNEFKKFKKIHSVLYYLMV